MRIAAAAALACLLLGGAAQARVTDPTAIAPFDTRFDIGAASPVGMAGGAAAANWRYFIMEGALGWGLTGAHLTLMPKIPLSRWGVNTLMFGLGGTVTIPTIWSKLGYRWTLWETAELSW